MSIDRIISDLVGYKEYSMHFPGELRSLNRLADGVHEGVIVAVGSYRGQSDCALALHAHVPVYAIDPRIPYDYANQIFGDADRKFWMENVLSLGLAEKIRPINLTSLEAATVWSQPIGLLFIDGAHNYAAVKADLDAWLPHVLPDGIVCLHDANAPGVLPALLERPDLVEFERADITVACRKTPNLEQVNYEGLNAWVRLGPYHKDDLYVLGEVRSYALGDDPVRTCVDIGGHIGAFTLWVHGLYPDAQYIALEPEPSGFRALQANVGAFASTLNTAVSYSSAPMALHVDPVNSGSHRLMVQADVPAGLAHMPVPTTTLETILATFGIRQLDLLKLDCEGSEVDILLHCTDETLRQTRRIVGEFHNGYEHFRGTLGARLQALGFQVEATQDPLAHATFWAQNTQWVEAEPADETPEPESAPPVDRPKRPSSRAGKGRAK